MHVLLGTSTSTALRSKYIDRVKHDHRVPVAIGIEMPVSRCQQHIELKVS